MQKTNNIVISFRINKEINDYINFLKINKVRYTVIMRDAIRTELKNKCNEFNYKSKKEILPF